MTLTLAINRVLEGWIRERPDQWQWLHRRWAVTRRYSPRYKRQHPEEERERLEKERLEKERQESENRPFWRR